MVVEIGNLDNPLEKNDNILETSSEINNLKKEIEGSKILYKRGKLKPGGGGSVEKKGNDGNEKLAGVPNNIRGIAQEKLKNKYAAEAWREYRNLKGSKPDFFPFLCSYIGYKNIGAKSKILTIVDYSKGGSGHGLLYMIDMRSHNVLLQTTAVKGNGGFSNVPDSHKSSLGFSQVYGGIRTDGSTGPHVILDGLEQGFNSNMKDRKMYLHGGTKSEGCVVVPAGQRSFILNTVANSDSLVFQYYPDVNYLKNSRKLK